VLFEECKKVNPQSYIVDEPKNINPSWFDNAKSVGICGATSTPKWLMEACREAILSTQDK
jgi:4-hydroxy-3-methylbut-2-enyl diphosphate reductase